MSSANRELIEYVRNEDFNKADQSQSVPGSLSNNVKNTGRWTSEEHKEFLHGLQMYGKNWKKISTHVHTRTPVQIRTHAQKYFLKRERKRNLVAKKMGLYKEKSSMNRDVQGQVKGEDRLVGKRIKSAIDKEATDCSIVKKVKEDPLATCLDFDDVAGEAYSQGMDFVPTEGLFADDPFVIPSEFDVYTPRVTNALDKPSYDFNFEKDKPKQQEFGLHRTLGLHLDPLLGHDISPIPYKGQVDLFDYPVAHDAEGLLFDI